MLRRLLAGAVAPAWIFIAANTAEAGIPECGDIRLEDVRSCEIRGDLQCSAGCDELGVYKKACATKLHTVCRSECTLSADADCTDSCTEVCTQQCDLGVNITCQHNCFEECVGSCDSTCAGLPDEETCQASCEATCDGECDVKCRPLVEGSCYEHCIECCGGSCSAQVNMECQTSCQEEQFEDCEYELKADCSAECRGGGAIFCDDEYVLGGEDIPACAQELVTRGIAELDLQAVGSIDFSGGGSGPASGAARGKARASCQAAPGQSSAGFGGFALLTLCLALARRARAPRCD
jgi:MYXO-CTERM domain-containing protein